MEGYPYTYFHKGCGGVCFYSKKEFRDGDIADLTVCLRPDLTVPKHGDYMDCSKCKRRVFFCQHDLFCEKRE